MEKVANTQTQAKPQAKPQTNEKAVAKSAEDQAAFKAKKAEAAKRFAENQKARKEALVKAAHELADKKILEKLTPESQKFFNDILNPAKSSGFGGTSFFNKVFGDNPKVGDSINVLDYLKKTMKSKADLDKRVKEWAEKGITVEVKEAANPLETTYTITKLA